MAVFKGGPALPKRSDIMCNANNPSPASPSKRKARTTPLLANTSDHLKTQIKAEAMDMESDNDPNVSIFAERDDIRPTTVIEGGETVIPTSNVRSSLAKAAMEKETLENADQTSKLKSPSRVRKTMENEEAVSQPSTPKKARTKAASPSAKDVVKTPTKKEPSSALTTPRESAPLASAWQPDHWSDLNFAILKVAHDHAAELYDASPNLLPWKIKGRLLVKLRQLMKEASGGDAASKRWDVEQKPNRKSGSPKKQQQ